MVIALKFVVIFMVASVLCVERNQTSEQPLRRHKRVIGGREASIVNHPYHVAIAQNLYSHTVLGIKFYKWVYKCGGTIIGRYWVLTSAQCVFKDGTNEIPPIGVAVGLSHADYGWQKWWNYFEEVRSIITHPCFENGSIANHSPAMHNIALIELRYPLTFSKYVSTATLSPKQIPVPGGVLTTTGFGYTDVDGKNDKKKLYETEVTIVDTKECQDYWGDAFIGDSNICVRGSHATHTATCEGDEGSPLIQKGPGPLLRGINSWKLTCTEPWAPEVFTDSGFYFDWIVKVVAWYNYRHGRALYTEKPTTEECWRHPY